MRRKIYFATLFALVTALFVLLRPTLFVFVGDEAIYCGRADEGVPIVVNYVHSVQKTPVEENLVVAGNGFRLVSTRYQSFGVGLPFLAEEGNFRHEGNFFIMDDMNRFYPQISFLVGLGTRLSLTVGSKKLPLHEMYPVGTTVDLVIAPFCEKYSRHSQR